MSSTFVEPKQTSSFRDQAAARNLERLAWLMDRVVTIPGTKVSFGLDALLGLLPVGGDVATGFVQIGIVLFALRHYHVPPAIAKRMMANVLLDVAVGAIPFLGDLFDVGFKANTRNVRLLEEYHDQQSATTGVGHTGSSAARLLSLAHHGATPWRYVVPIAAAMILVLALVMIGFITVVRWLFHF